MPATSKSSLPAPRNNWEEINAKRADRKAAFIRDAAARIVAADLQRDKSTLLEQDVDVAEMLADILTERGYL